jgi:hypothetical protein
MPHKAGPILEALQGMLLNCMVFLSQRSLLSSEFHQLEVLKVAVDASVSILLVSSKYLNQADKQIIVFYL